MAQEKNKIGQYLKRFREAFNLQQNKVAESIGILPQLYLKYEKDKSVPSASVIINLANAYNVSADYLLGLSDSPHPTPYDEKEVRAAFEFRDTWLKMQKLESALKQAGQVPAQ
ncbi:MAG: helix-turn-helix transcriptional regulator [Selenomonadaceae bacterium]|nr:helix-turn-helix transcriptional regulator [Selenomonadaceae bacterium]